MRCPVLIWRMAISGAADRSSAAAGCRAQALLGSGNLHGGPGELGVQSTDSGGRGCSRHLGVSVGMEEAARNRAAAELQARVRRRKAQRG
eukprot:193374-Rhodomonas_salina.1